MTLADRPRKRIERSALDRFLVLLGEPDPDTIDATEEPDVLLTFGSHSVGVEVTDLYWNHPRGRRPRQEQESLRHRVVALAQQLYADRRLPAVDVSIHFNDQFPLDKSAVGPLAARIADWVAGRIPESGGSFSEEYDWLNREYFPEELHQLRIYRYESITRPRFSAPDADYVPELTTSDVRRVLDRKNPLYGAYLRRCQAAWLVINVNTSRLSMTFDTNDSVAATMYETPFDRVFIIQHVTPHLCELRRSRDTRDDV